MLPSFSKAFNSALIFLWKVMSEIGLSSILRLWDTLLTSFTHYLEWNAGAIFHTTDIQALGKNLALPWE